MAVNAVWNFTAAEHARLLAVFARKKQTKSPTYAQSMEHMTELMTMRPAGTIVCAGRYDNLLRKKAAQLYKDSCDSQPGRRGPARQTVKDGVDWEEVVSGETRVVDAPGLLQGGAAYVPAAAAGPWFQIPPAGITVLGGGSGTITDQNGTNILLTVNDVAARVNKAAVKGFPTPMQIAATGWDDDNGGAADKLRQLPATLASLRDIWQRIRNYGAAQGWAAYNGPAVHGGQIQSHIDAILAVSQG